MVIGNNKFGDIYHFRLQFCKAENFPRLEVVFGDNKYHNHGLEAWLQAERPNWRIEVKSRPEGTRGFTPLEKRWVVFFVNKHLEQGLRLNAKADFLHI